MKIIETFAPPSAAEMLSRTARLQAALGANGLEAYVASAPANVLWLTNFANFVHERPFILVVPRMGTPKFIVPRLELDHIAVRHVGDIEAVDYFEYPAPKGQRWQDRLAEVLPARGAVGIETMLPHAIVRRIGERARAIDLADKLREVKSPYELGRIKYGCRLLSEAHRELLENARPGLSQSEVNRTVGRGIHARLVADNPSLNPFATSIMTWFQNPDVSHDPHNFTDLDMKMLPGGPHVTVFNAVLNGYGAEIERTFFIGTVPDAAKKPFDAMMRARRLVFDMTRPGVLLGDIDRAASALFEKLGFGDNRIHRAGHGMGVTAHEGPFIADGDDGVLAEGMTFSIEPGIYLPGIGGFRHSDTAVVTADGVLPLTWGPEMLDDLTL